MTWAREKDAWDLPGLTHQQFQRQATEAILRLIFIEVYNKKWLFPFSVLFGFYLILRCLIFGQSKCNEDNGTSLDNWTDHKHKNWEFSEVIIAAGTFFPTGFLPEKACLIKRCSHHDRARDGTKESDTNPLYSYSNGTVGSGNRSARDREWRWLTICVCTVEDWFNTYRGWLQHVCNEHL